MKKPLLYLALFVFYLLHNDLWLWHDARIVLGLPIGLLYRISYNIGAAVMMILLVTYAWPHHLEIDDEDAA